jgi:large subunit ribosomal protein L24
MKKKGTIKPSKNRKKMINAPNHIKKRYLTSPLSTSLKTQYGTRSMPIRKDDVVTILKGDRKLSEGKIIRVDVKKSRIYVEGINRNKMDGSTVQISIRPENVMINQLNLDDPIRRKILDRRGFEAKKGER